MRRALILAAALAALAGCTPLHVAGEAAIGAGHLALGAADLVI